MKPFSADNLMTGGLPAQRTERQVYDEIVSGTRCAQDVLDECELDTYHRRRIIAALTNDDQASEDAYMDHWRLKVLNDQVTKSGPLANGRAVFLAWTPGRAHGVVLAEYEGYALVRTRSGSREVWQLNQTMQVGPDPDVMRQVDELYRRIEAKAAWVERYRTQNNDELLVDAEAQLSQMRALAERLTAHAWDWCKEVSE
jgi:hypothetical protein